MICHACASANSGPFAPDGTSSHYPPDQSIVVVHVDLSLRLDLAAKRLVGRSVQRLSGREGARRIELDALDFESLTVEGATYAYDGSKVRIAFGRPFEEGTLFRLGAAFQSVTDWHRRRPPLPRA